jgi:hypothetical protein
MEYRVLEASKDEAILVLPVKGAQEVLFKVAEAAQKVSDSTPILPDGRKLVIVQNTDKVTYLVISNIKEVSAGADMSGMPVDVLGGSVVSRTFLAVNVFVAAEAVALADAGMAVTAVAFAVAI